MYLRFVDVRRYSLNAFSVLLQQEDTENGVVVVRKTAVTMSATGLVPKDLSAEEEEEGDIDEDMCVELPPPMEAIHTHTLPQPQPSAQDDVYSHLVTHRNISWHSAD